MTAVDTTSATAVIEPTPPDHARRGASRARRSNGETSATMATRITAASAISGSFSSHHQPDPTVDRGSRPTWYSTPVAATAAVMCHR